MPPNVWNSPYLSSTGSFLLINLLNGRHQKKYQGDQNDFQLLLLRFNSLQKEWNYLNVQEGKQKPPHLGHMNRCILPIGGIDRQLVLPMVSRHFQLWILKLYIHSTGEGWSVHLSPWRGSWDIRSTSIFSRPGTLSVQLGGLLQQDQLSAVMVGAVIIVFGQSFFPVW